jgi:folate-binding protein YgfZ
MPEPYSEPSYILLKDRAILSVAGEDAVEFLQGLVSNDTHKVGPERAIHAALLTPQGKFLHDFFVVQGAEGLLLDCEGGRADDLKRRLGLYKLRSRVTVEDRSESFAVAALLGDGWPEAAGLSPERGRAAPLASGVAYVDPRHAGLGGRALVLADGVRAALEDAGFKAADADAYDSLRLSLGIPDGSRDTVVEKAVLLECGFDEMGSVDWDKGCYMGQELTARTKYRGLVKKRLVPVRIDGPLPDAGTPVMLADREAGEVRSGRDGIALALLRLERMQEAADSGTPLTAGEARLTPEKPDWVSF